MTATGTHDAKCLSKAKIFVRGFGELLYNSNKAAIAVRGGFACVFVDASFVPSCLHRTTPEFTRFELFGERKQKAGVLDP